MSVFKCKMCGGTIEFESGATVGVCDSCGTKQTLPKTGDDNIANLFNRANNLRLKCEFDKASAIYEKIVEQDDSEAEAHWGIILCKYGIEYVDDPKTGKKIPTCHRTLFEAVTADADYQAAIDYSDASQQALYEAEAREIDRIQKDILSIVKNEKPFDVFICYKETDENGKRTQDSVIANDIYYQLTQEGFKVFYAAITLEDKLGREYEPYIFAALNSAKVMLVVGTNPLYFNSVWVRNEWSRYLALMKTDRSKLLIPCYRDMDAYELPEEFAHLQAQDMSKIGFINDVIRGIKKVIAGPSSQSNETGDDNAQKEGTPGVASLLKRVFIFLEDGEWNDAVAYAEKALDIDAECAEAYLGKLMANLKVRKVDDFQNCIVSFDEDNNYKKVVRFGSEELKKTIESYSKLARQKEHDLKVKAEKEKIDGYDKYRLKVEELATTIRKLKAKLKATSAFNFSERIKISQRIKSLELELGEEDSKRINHLHSLSVQDQLIATGGKSIVYGNFHGLIEWIVLSKEKSRVLVISKYALGCSFFSDSSSDVTWGNSYLRQWLNDKFLMEHFSTNEQLSIQMTSIPAHKNPKSKVDPGNYTEDKVFLLSIDEAQKYFLDDKSRICIPTEYAVKQTASTERGYADDNQKSCYWWLRTPGKTNEQVSCVSCNGMIDYTGYWGISTGNCVRPAMWISLE